MANENIVSGLFGLTPAQIQQRQQAELAAAALRHAQLDPFQRASSGMFQGAGQLGGLLAERMGGVNAEVAEAQRTNTAMQGDMESPQGLRAMADRMRQAGDLQRAFALSQLANKREVELRTGEVQSAQMAKYLAEAEKAQRPAGEGGATPVVAKLLAERSKYQPGTQEYKALTDAIKKETYIKPEGVTGDTPQEKLLNKDQRWVQKDGQWVAEIIPGTKTFNAQKNAYAADLDAVKTIDDSYKASKEKIGFILSEENKDAFGNLFGGYTEKFVGQYLSGKTATVKQKLESLKSEMKATGLQIMRAGGGVGQITEREWKIMEDMIDSLSPEMEEQAARNVLQNIEARMAAAKERAEAKFGAEWSGSQFEKSGKSNASVSNW